jgi:hypothetical protein
MSYCAPCPVARGLKRPVGVEREGWNLNIFRRAKAGGVQGIELQVEVAVTVLPQQFPMFSHRKLLRQ